jgi:membrane peptidoglycan carboxypeptidase
LSAWLGDAARSATGKYKTGNRGDAVVKRAVKLLLLLTVVVVVGLLANHEAKYSIIQARLISRFAANLNFSVENGKSNSIVFPAHGPDDLRLGYVQLPELIAKMENKGMVVSRQARFNDQLNSYARNGFYPPYQPKEQSGLQIFDREDRRMYQLSNPRRVFADFYQIPLLLTKSLLFIEDRQLLDDSARKMNPAVSWGRFTKAAAMQVGELMNIEVDPMGGSTLATQFEKYHHSAGGITSSGWEKLVQMASASVRAYRDGEDTFAWRQQLVRLYINSVPLAAAPGIGEVHGVGDGMYIWYDVELDELNRLLAGDLSANGLQGAKKAQVYKELLSLLIGHRRPSYYLFTGRNELAALTNSYLRLLAEAGVIPFAFSKEAQAQSLVFRDFARNPPTRAIVQNKGSNLIRNRLATLFGKSLYELDRFDLRVFTGLDMKLQERVDSYLRELRDPGAATTAGIVGKFLLSEAQTKDVGYSFTLFERTEEGNQVRVQTDTTGLPLDINEGSKLELGSTAKLRTLATYLEIIAELYTKMSLLPLRELDRILRSTDPDPLTRWVAGRLLAGTSGDLAATLQAAMLRTYSANPSERFFTGGGVHLFNNFRAEDNQRTVTVAEALAQSINLPFIRIMQDVVKYTRGIQWEDPRLVLKDDADPRRREVLTRFIDKESRVFLGRFWQKYHGKDEAARLETLVSGLRPSPKRLTVIFRHLYPDAPPERLGRFLQENLPDSSIAPAALAGLYNKYAPDAFNLTDKGYLASVHPLELWLLSYLQRSTKPTLAEATEESGEIRHEVYGWLLRTRAKNARDQRIRTMLEIDAFSDIHRRWQRLGYPFDNLVPSLATALGSSGDKPSALAELVGIILNRGQKAPSFRLNRLEFGIKTPYETVLVNGKDQSGQVMLPEVAAVLQEALASVVAVGTARRLAPALALGDGRILMAGGKTGTGDNRIVTSHASGNKIRSTARNRTATFVFFLGQRYFGTLTAFVTGNASADFHFTSALPVQVLKSMTPILLPYLASADSAGSAVGVLQQ